MGGIHEHLNQARRGIARYHRESASVASAFTAMHEAALRDGAMGRDVKELMAVSIALVTHCAGCVAWHLSAAAGAGATRAMAVEALDVAVLMGGGPSMISVSEVMDMIDELYPQ